MQILIFSSVVQKNVQSSFLHDDDIWVESRKRRRGGGGGWKKKEEEEEKKEEEIEDQFLRRNDRQLGFQAIFDDSFRITELNKATLFFL